MGVELAASIKQTKEFFGFSTKSIPVSIQTCSVEGWVHELSYHLLQHTSIQIWMTDFADWFMNFEKNVSRFSEKYVTLLFSDLYLFFGKSFLNFSANSFLMALNKDLFTTSARCFRLPEYYIKPFRPKLWQILKIWETNSKLTFKELSDSEESE